MIGLSRLGVVVTTKTRSAVDAFVARDLAAITSAQAAYLLANGRYFQGLLTHAAAPPHTDSTTAAVTPGQLATAPTDQQTTWATFMPSWVGQGLPGRVRVDAYDGPSGQGWTLETDATHNGVKYLRIRNAGPETWREQAWRVVA